MISGSFLLNDDSPKTAFPNPELIAFPVAETASGLSLPDTLRQNRRAKHQALKFAAMLMRERGQSDFLPPLEEICVYHFETILSEDNENKENDLMPFLIFRKIEKDAELDFDDAGQRAARRMAEESLPELWLESEDADFVSHLQRNARAAKELCLFLLYQQKVQCPDLDEILPELVASLGELIAMVYALDTLALFVARSSEPSEAKEKTLTLASAEIAQRTFLATIATLRELPSIEDLVEWRDNPLCRLRTLLDGLMYRI